MRPSLWSTIRHGTTFCLEQRFFFALSHLTLSLTFIDSIFVDVTDMVTVRVSDPDQHLICTVPVFIELLDLGPVSGLQRRLEF